MHMQTALLMETAVPAPERHLALSIAWVPFGHSDKGQSQCAAGFSIVSFLVVRRIGNSDGRRHDSGPFNPDHGDVHLVQVGTSQWTRNAYSSLVALV